MSRPPSTKHGGFASNASSARSSFRSGGHQADGATWRRDARAALAIPAHTRGYKIEAGSKFLFGAVALAILAFLVYQADHFVSWSKSKAAEDPTFDQTYVADTPIRAGDVAFFTANGRIAAGMRVETRSFVSNVVTASVDGVPTATPMTTATPTVTASVASIDAATGAAGIAAFRLVDVASGSSVVTSLVFASALPDAITSDAVTITGMTAGGSPSQPRALAAAHTDAAGGPTAALTWHVGGAGGDEHRLVLTSRASAAVSSWSHTDVVMQPETIASTWASVAARAFVAPIGTAGFVVGYQCVNACCLRFVSSSSSSSSAADAVGAETSLGQLSFPGACPKAAPLVYADNLLVLVHPTGSAIEVFVVDTAAKSFRHGSTTSLNLPANTANPPVLVPVPVAAQSVAGIVAISGSESGSSAIVASALRYDAATRGFVYAFQTIAKAKTGGIEWSAIPTAGAYRSISQDVLVTVLDSAGRTLAVIIDVVRAGSASSFAVVPNVAGMVPRSMAAVASGTVALMAVSVAEPSRVSAFSITWLGGLYPAGIARTGAAAGDSVSVILSGVARVSEGPMALGHGYAVNTRGTLSAESGLSAASPTVGTAIGANRIFVQLLTSNQA